MSELPRRPGARPRTTTRLPHMQLDQQPCDDSLTTLAIDEALSWPGVRRESSLVSVKDAAALALDPSAARGPAEAFMAGTEFAHAHAGKDRSLHLTLPRTLAEEATRAHWAEPHYLVRSGEMPPTLVMVYAPRDHSELAVIRMLLRTSYDFASATESVVAAVVPPSTPIEPGERS